MGYLLTLLVIAIIISCVVYIASKELDKIDDTRICILICVLVGAIIFFIPIIGSYASHLKMRGQLATVSQYSDSIKIYYERGVRDVAISSAAGSEITDLKYNNYQNKIADLIMDYRTVITDYNNMLARKGTMNASWYWNWVIILPDDMEPMVMDQ